ncbi:redox-sensing transcriptional repressor Rex [Desulfoplanes formicivorans]|uniref:Redox-sensing transcriptional repressor Rex n=1 Tax=Desulfoplanes formicivorans TaxID=1592317 RepID=A0A194AGE0_9BACT|nr:redox-sensing transcriptional repressor Rex [Desulfoplanes formicivorans]GAU08393.1 REX family transcriptional regulator [Desulfoplanes formicivorans]
MKSTRIPRATIQRLAAYVQILETLSQEGEKVISSEGLARACGVNPSQIRKDLAYFGEFGVRGVGYYVQDLLTAIKQSLGIDRIWNVALVGVGNLGRALLRHKILRKRGFMVVGAFDCDPFKIGEEIAGLEVYSSKRLQELAQELNVEIGVITTPPKRAQRAANYLVEAGVKGIVNFAPVRIDVPENVAVEYVDFIHHLFSVAFNISLNLSKGLF